MPSVPRVVIVLGPYRSGTSLTARIISDLGADFGPAEGLIPADERNPSGYLERDVVNDANRDFIASTNGTLENPGDPGNLLAHGDRSHLLGTDLAWLHAAPLAGIKDPRMCATLAAWFDAGLLAPATTLVVHITRDLESTLQSALKHDHVAAYADRDPTRLRAMIERYAAAALWQLKRFPAPRIDIAYEDLLAQPVESTTRLAHSLGVTCPLIIRRAAANIGRDRARASLHMRRRFIALRFRLGNWKSALLRRRPPSA
ncbi:sulfotransferase [Synoicihabitans lomoniglobus]|uniref:Sulfotransferase n=1 Tax=Synoicihabitans lomoniglobus TaxID=2909285 RepID=A0AAF0CSL1_9BACT|nr:sulfotransferase [Opitutaceae bacterium LMO-M01]WED67329.1 sulfotransferase [Opitutaceae bacterium LMO-M01]